MNNTPITVRRYTSFDEIKADEYGYCKVGPRMNG
jgi:hypothetical protein